MSIQELERLVNERRYMAARVLFGQVVAGDGFQEGTYALACHLTAVAEVGLGNRERSIILSQEADALATLTGDWNLVARVGQNLIDLLRQAGEYGAAQERGLRWLEEIALYPDMAARQGRVEYNLALAYWSAGHSAPARPFLADAVMHMAEAEEQPIFRVMALQMQARLAYADEDFDTGDGAWNAAEELITPSDLEGRREQLLLQAFRAFYSLEDDHAIELCEEFVPPNTPTTRLQRLAATWIAGTIAAKKGYWELAREMAEALQRLSVDGNTIISTHYLNGAHEILRRIEMYQSLTTETGET